VKLALGTAQFGFPYGIANASGQVCLDEAAAILDQAWKAGFRVLDTAIAYGDSEACLGEVGIRGFNIITKLPAVPENCDDIAGWVHGQIAASLGRLRVASMHGVLLHRPDQLLSRDGKVLFRALQSLKDNGQAQKIGVSIYSAA